MIKEINGIKVEIIKKKIKNINMYIKSPDGRILITAPQNVSDERIEAFVTEKTEWINKHLEKLRSRPEPKIMQYISGESIRILGKEYILELKAGERDSFSVLGDKAVLILKNEKTREQKEAIINKYLKELLSEKIEKRLPVWEKITGLYCSGWQIKNMKTRWGSCNTVTKRITFNLQLALKSVECIEYIIIHELGHIKISGHGADFKAYMDEYMKGWRHIKSNLNA